MEGKKDGEKYSYINDIQYNKFGAKTSVMYGNGTRTDYTYYPKTQRLAQNAVKTK